ncbi:MAG: HEAT repeat domain-containing protein [Deltaproteobacteria bacterium]|nr:HEAT repeat domain-containing protein [Deltaproteobacteria bacterium]
MRRWLLIAGFSLVAGPALAQMSGNVDRLKADLHGENLDRAVAAASALGSLKTPPARDALVGALQLGCPPKLLTALLEALGQHKSDDTIPLLKLFAHNRTPEIRVAALQALGRNESPQTVGPLIDALGDSNPMVRASAARMLGDRQEKRAESALFMLVKRKDVSAAAPLGKVAGVETAKNLGELIGEVPDRAIALAYGEMLKRKEFGPDPLRMQIVKALGKLPGSDATTALVEYIASVPPKDIRLSKKMAERLLAGRQK